MSEAPTGQPVLSGRGLTVGYGTGPVVLDGVDIDLPGGQITSIVGPNGCGKSTLLRTLARLLSPSRGEVLLDGEPIRSLRGRTLATRLAVLPQTPQAPEGLTVADLAARGRSPHQPWYRQWSPEDERIAAEAIAQTGMTDYSERMLDELSGGQRQRAWIAMTLAQQTPILLLDEPTTHLDLAHAVDVLDLVVDLCRDHGKTIVMVVHDLGLAARFSDHLIAMRQGAVVAQGSPEEVLTEANLQDIFGLRAHVFPDPQDGLVTVVPSGSARAGGARVSP